MLEAVSGKGPIDKGAKNVSNTSNIRSDTGIMASDHYLTVLFQQCY